MSEATLELGSLAGEHRDRVQQQQAMADLMTITEMPEGRRLLMRILRLCRTDDQSMTGNSYTYFNEGMRQVGCVIRDEIKALSFHRWQQMELEYHEFERRMQEIEESAERSDDFEPTMETEI